MAMVGCGAIAQWRLHAIQTAVPEIDVTAAVDVDPQRVEELAATASARPFADLLAQGAIGELRAALAMYRAHETRQWEPTW